MTTTTEKVSAYRVEMRDENDRGTFGFVAATDARDAILQARGLFDYQRIEDVFGPFEIDRRMVANR